MSPSSVDVHIEAHGSAGEVATVTVNRPSKLNALDLAQCQRLGDAFTELHDRDTLRAVVLTGAGDRAFIGGADINELEHLDAATGRAFITAIHDVCTAMRQCPVPVVGRINGYCLGAGMEIAAACDLRIASDAVVFGMPEVKIGLPSVIEAALLPSLIGWGRTRWLVLTAQNISATTAHGWGFTEELVGAPELDGAVAATVKAIVGCAPQAVRDQKALVARWERLNIDDAIAAGIDAFAKTCEGDEHRRYVGAFKAGQSN
jgi:enoyl-CoA hydratase